LTQNNLANGISLLDQYSSHIQFREVVQGSKTLDLTQWIIDHHRTPASEQVKEGMSLGHYQRVAESFKQALASLDIAKDLNIQCHKQRLYQEEIKKRLALIVFLYHNNSKG
jgi:hypothetical protein